MSTTPDPRRGHSRLRPFIWGLAAALLLLPAVAMRFTAEVDWDAHDFAVMGVMLAAACGIYELGVWLSASRAYRAGFGTAVVTGLMTVWVNLAVGMFGSEENPLNLMFAGVLLVAAVGSLVVKFRALGMASAMAVTALAQLFAAGLGLVVGLSVGTDERGGPSIFLETCLTAGFALPWLVASWFFRIAGKNEQAE